MVKILRSNPRKRRKFTIFSIKNGFLFIVGVVCLRLMTYSPVVNDGNSNLSPKNLKEQLAESKKSGGTIRKKEEPKPENATEEPVTENPGNKAEDRKTDAPNDAATENPNAEKGQKAVKDASSPTDLNPIVIDKKGTGPTSVGYVKDFVWERNNQSYKNPEIPVPDPSPQVAKMVNEKSVTPCRDETTGSINARCMDDDTPLIAHNSQSFDRTWCGQKINGKSAVAMTEHCNDPVTYLFPAQVPPVTGDGMPPIIIKSSMDKELREEDLENVECNISCQQEKGLDIHQTKAGHNYFIDGESWKINMNFGSGQSMKNREDYMAEQYYSTGSLLSSIPLSNFNSNIHSLRDRPAVDFDTAQEKAIYLVDQNCSPHATKRNRWFEAVDKIMTVDSYGSCGHNIEVPNGISITTPEGRIALSKQYRIVLAFDETTTKDHISDLVFEAFVSGAVPAVVGAENIRERFPPHSFINVNDFSKWDDFSKYVKKVASDKKLWLSYHNWRDDEKAIEAFMKQFEFTSTDSTCRFCRWAYAKKYGLGWDHKAQEVRSISKVPKDKFCTTADHGLVSKPFFEQWATKKSGEEDEKFLEEDSEGESCSSLTTNGGVTVDSFSAYRKVVHHDGVTDFVITEMTDETRSAESVLRLKFPGVRNPEGACIHNTHLSVSTVKGSKVSSVSIADDLVKITILADWDTTIKSSGEGIVEIAVNQSESKSNKDVSLPKRVRVIIEEMNEVFDKMTEFHPSSFYKLMARDFIDPIGVFFVNS